MTRSPQKSLGDALIHFALMREHAQGNLEARSRAGCDLGSLLDRVYRPRATEHPMTGVSVEVAQFAFGG